MNNKLSKRALKKMEKKAKKNTLLSFAGKAIGQQFSVKMNYDLPKDRVIKNAPKETKTVYTQAIVF